MKASTALREATLLAIAQVNQSLSGEAVVQKFWIESGRMGQRVLQPGEGSLPKDSTGPWASVRAAALLV